MNTDIANENQHLIKYSFEARERMDISKHKVKQLLKMQNTKAVKNGKNHSLKCTVMYIYIVWKSSS